LLGGKGTSVFTTTLLVIGGTAPLLSAIKRNQHQELN